VTGGFFGYYMDFVNMKNKRKGVPSGAFSCRTLQKNAKKAHTEIKKNAKKGIHLSRLVPPSKGEAGLHALRLK
jgi:hypothetical protein